jgi:hypothetical protein
MNTRQRVRSSDWKLSPPDDSTRTLVVGRRYTADQMARIDLGFCPACMDDKWFVYKEGDDLFFHRSWTGYWVFTARFEATADGATLTTLQTLEHRFTEQEGTEVSLALGLIERFLLEDRPSADGLAVVHEDA